MGLILGGDYTEEINEKSLAVSVLSLLSYVYVQGVKDAYNARDEMLCRDFIEHTDEAGVFGFLWKEREARFDMNTWSDRDFICELISFAYSKRVPGRKHLIRYMQRILNPSTYHFCMLHVAQEFYKRGMLDYIKYPNPTKIHTITQSPLNKVWEKEGGKKESRQDTIHHIHEACRDRALRCEESLQKDPKNKFATLRSRFENFQKSLWRALNNEERKEKRNTYRVVEVGGWRTDRTVARQSGKRGRPPKERGAQA